MSGLQRDVKQQGKLVVILAVILCVIVGRGCYLEKKENYTDLHKRVSELERKYP